MERLARPVFDFTIQRFKNSTAAQVRYSSVVRISMKLTPFISGTFGTIGFVLSLLAGMFADNAIEDIMLKAMMFAVICYVVGYGVGIVAERVAAEHATQLAKKVAEEDAAQETARLEQEVAAEAEAAGMNAADPPLTSPVGAIAAKT
jgi:hypothetical protein